MLFHLYRPITWVRGGTAVAIDHTYAPSDYEMALLVRLKRATFLPSPTHTIGEPMSDDSSSALQLVLAPTSEPLTLDQAKAFLRIENTADDDAVTRAITAARQAAELYLRQALLPQTWDFTQANPQPTKLRLPFGPAQSITSITLTTAAGVVSTMNTTNYRLAVGGFVVLFCPEVSIEKMTIRYVAGIGTAAADIPSMIVQGMLHHIAAMVENRDGTAAMPMQTMACYLPYRRISL